MQTKGETGTKEELRQLAVQVGAFHRLLEALRDRQRDPNNHETNLDDLTAHGASRAKAVECFRALQKAGYGELKVGRRQKRTRFIWSTSAKEAARELLAEPENPEAESPTVRSAGSHAHTFLLRPGLVVRIALPLDVGADEARRLAEFVRSLPFEREVRSQDATPTAED